METSLDEFTYFWLNGKREVFKGTDPVDALNKAGYGGGAVPALDFYDYGDNHDWEWDKKEKIWKRKK